MSGLAAKRRLGRRQPGDRRAVGRAGDVIQPHRVAEGDRGRVAAVLAADAELQIRTGPPSTLDGDMYHLAHSIGVQRNERIVLEDPESLINADKGGRVIA